MELRTKYINNLVHASIHFYIVLKHNTELQIEK